MAVFTAILGALAVIIGGIMSTNAQERANEQNIAAANNSLLEQERFATESAQKANEEQVRQYNNLYSPAAIVNQQRNAGLSISYLYGKGGGGAGGTSAAQAAQPTQSSPYINPTLAMSSLSELAGLPNQLANAKKTEKESRKIDKELEVMEATKRNLEESTEKIAAEIPMINKTIEKFDYEINDLVKSANLKEAQTTVANWEAKNKEFEAKYQEATLEDRVKLVSEQLNYLQQQEELIQEQTKHEQIDNKTRERINRATLAKIKAETDKLIAEKGLAVAQEVLTEAQQRFTDEQTELTKDKRDFMVVETRKMNKEINIAEEEYKKLKKDVEQYEAHYWAANTSGLERLWGIAVDLYDRTIGNAIKNAGN